MPIPQGLVDRMMVECGRRCCVCRRFRPTWLQVHHIIERSNGGSDDWDNLISLCLTCHTDVHSTVPFTRRFTPEELKGHRDSLIQLVASGGFDANEPDRFSPLTLVARDFDSGGLSKEAVELLLLAAAGQAGRQGLIIVRRSNLGEGFFAGNSMQLNPNGDNRRAADYVSALSELEERRFAESQNGDFYYLTKEGHLAADELSSQAAQEG